MSKKEQIESRKNKLYFGDCLEILNKFYEQNKEGFIDLVYIDPPFNSKRNYNILFEQVDFKDAKAQKEAFADTWSNVSYKDTINNIKALDLNLYNFLNSLDQICIPKSAVSYLTTMSIRIFYISKIIKDTGSFYLHCDPTMSHYLKIICDLIFGEKNFRNEIIWHYRKWSIKQTQFCSNHDVILFYCKDSKEERVFNHPYMDRAASTLRRFGKKKIVSGHDKEGKRLPATTEEDDSLGVPMDDVWDISRVPPIKQIYPTEKPEKLLERIIEASTNEGDLVADFFCGCGTTVSVAQRLKRKWIGVDISHLAIGLIERRINDSYPETIKGSYEIHGFPKDIASAKELANNIEGGRLEFQDWIIEAKIGGVCNPKKTADGGWDGHMTFDLQGDKKVILIEVKSGNVNVKNLREFIQVTNKTNSDIGVFVCFQEQITKPMLLAAKEEGYFEEELFGCRYDRIQIISVEDLLEGKTVFYPESRKETFKKADKKSTSRDSQQSLFS